MNTTYELIKWVIIIGVKILLKSKGGSISSALAIELMKYIVASNGNPVTKEMLSEAITAIKGTDPLIDTALDIIEKGK